MQEPQRPSPLESARLDYEPELPQLLTAAIGELAFEELKPTGAVGDPDEIRGAFPRTFGRPTLRLVRGDGCERRPLRIGVVLSGGQAPGGHNVITGLFDALQSVDPASRLVGFLGGPRGILDARFLELDGETLGPYRNTGGFDLLGSGRDKIETVFQLEAAAATCRQLELDGLVVIGGDDSNTNAAVLAEYLLDEGEKVAVVGVPKTIDGDMKGEHVDITFGFDTATRVYSELIGNIARDAKSAAKYWHFIKLMGRSASHVTLECALQTAPNLVLIGEEIERRGMSLDAIVDQVAEAVRLRASAGTHHGVCLVPEGLVEFIPAVRLLIDELNEIVSDAVELDRLDGVNAKRSFVVGHLSDDGRRAFAELPESIQDQLVLDRDAHGNVQVSRIDTEKLLICKVEERIRRWKAAGEFPGKFSVQAHFLGYEGRCAAPTDFDASLTYGLGRLATLLVAFGHTGYLCSLRNPADPASAEPLGVPLTSMMRMEKRKGQRKPVIGKALVDLDGPLFARFARQRQEWLENDHYTYPGAIQYFGPRALTRPVNLTVAAGWAPKD